MASRTAAFQPIPPPVPQRGSRLYFDSRDAAAGKHRPAVQGGQDSARQHLPRPAEGQSRDPHRSRTKPLYPRFPSAWETLKMGSARSCYRGRPLLAPRRPLARRGVESRGVDHKFCGDAEAHGTETEAHPEHCSAGKNSARKTLAKTPRESRIAGHVGNLQKNMQTFANPFPSPALIVSQGKYRATLAQKWMYDSQNYDVPSAPSSKLQCGQKG